MNFFINNNLSFIAAAALTDQVQIKRVGDFDYRLEPGDIASSLWEKFQHDELVFSAKLLGEQIRELRKAPIQAGGQE